MRAYMRECTFTRRMFQAGPAILTFFGQVCGGSASPAEGGWGPPVPPLDASEIARELTAAYGSRHVLPAPLSSRDPAFDLSAAYAVEAELVRLRRAAGHATVGRKVGYANKAV